MNMKFIDFRNAVKKQFDSIKELRDGESVVVAKVKLKENGEMELIESIPESSSSRDVSSMNIGDSVISLKALPVGTYILEKVYIESDGELARDVRRLEIPLHFEELYSVMNACQECIECEIGEEE